MESILKDGDIIEHNGQYVFVNPSHNFGNDKEKLVDFVIKRIYYRHHHSPYKHDFLFGNEEAVSIINSHYNTAEHLVEKGFVIEATLNDDNISELKVRPYVDSEQFVMILMEKIPMDGKISIPHSKLPIDLGSLGTYLSKWFGCYCDGSLHDAGQKFRYRKHNIGNTVVIEKHPLY